MYSAGTDTSPLPTTTLRVTEVTQDSVRLDWFPLQGATRYIVRWKEETGKNNFFLSFCTFSLNHF